jgi:tRNA 2-thiouridine synthesizing protein A
MKESNQEVHADKELNLKGEICPYTFVRSKLAIEGMTAGQILRVIVDYEPAIRNVPRSMEAEGNEILGIDRINGAEWQILVRKKEAR